MRGVITIHGGGYVGLTSAVHYAKAGWNVMIFDPDQATVDGINAGTPRAGDFLAYLNQPVGELVKAGVLLATSDWGASVGRSAPVARWYPLYVVHSIAVPTEKDGEPYDDIVLDTLSRLGKHLDDDSTIIVESTLSPGTVDRLFTEHPEIRKRIERHTLYLAVCPRRDWFADPDKNLETLPRVVGGVTPHCTNRALEVLTTVSRTLLPTTHRTAEVVKALENALLHVPVMLCHQLALARPDLDVAEAVRLVTTHWRFKSLAPLYLGAGTGGRCVPLGSKYLTRAAGTRQLRIAEAALDADEAMRAAVAAVLLRRGNTSATLVLGIAYRPEFKDMGLSPGHAIATRLAHEHYPVLVHDPCWSPEEVFALTGLSAAPSSVSRTCTLFSNIVLATPHAVYLDWPLDAFRWRSGQLVLDAQGAWERHADRFMSYGVEYRRIGRPGWRD